MLVVCPPCGRKVSERAPVCPFCRTPSQRGHPSALVSPAAVTSGAPVEAAPPVNGRVGVLNPGDSIGSELQVLRVLGEGGFGVVYLARSSRVGFCAVKTLRDELVLDERVVDLFEKEARIWIELERHPYIVRAHYVERLGGRFYVAMEYVPPNDRGIHDLEGYLRRRVPELGQTLWWSIEFCHGMEYAYSKGVRCHRDIKPANILIGPDNRIRITDFGIAGVIVAKSESETPRPSVAIEGATQAGAVFGTPTHMPPEQFQDATRCDGRSDIYSFGVVLFQMVTGRLPFVPPPIPPGPDRSARTWTALAELHRGAPVPKNGSPLFPIIARCMEKDPADRYGSFPELRAGLEALLKKTTGEVVSVPPLHTFEAIDLVNKGMSFSALDQHLDALRCYDQALAIDPDSPKILNNKGNTLNRLRRRQEAMACFDRAIALDAAYAAPYLNKGISLVWLNRYPEALQYLDKAISLDARMVDAWVSKGVVLGRLGREDEAAECYERALDIDPGDPIAWFNKAGRLHGDGQREEALECIERALQSDPRYAVAWMTRGVLLGDLGRHQEALQAIERALVLDPNSAMSWYNKGNVFTSLESYGQALSCFEKATALEPAYPLCWYNRSLTEIKLERYDEAQTSLRRFLEVASPNDGFRRNAVSILERLQEGEKMRLGSLTKGATILTQDSESFSGVEVPLPSTPTDDGGARTKARELERLQAKLNANNLSTEELLEVARRIEELTPAAGALIQRALGVAGDYESDAPPSPVASAAQPKPTSGAPAPSPRIPVRAAPVPSVEECLRRANIVHAQGQFEKAVAWYDRALTADPDNAPAVAGKADSLKQLGRFDEAVSFYDRVLANNPQDVKAWLGHAAALAGARHHGEAATSYEKALQIDPTNISAWNGRGVSLFAAGQVEQALWCFDRALAEEPRFAMGRFNKAAAEEKLGRRSEAARSYQQFLNTAPPSLTRQIEMARARLAELRGP